MLLAVAACALAGFGVASSVATANNGATTTQFTAAYQLTGSAFATCSGVNIQKTAPQAFNKDSETCLLSGDDGVFPLGTTTYGFGVWFSDYYFFSLGQVVYAHTVTVTKVDNGDGTFTLDIVAYY
jgi:hypothetical protein